MRRRLALSASLVLGLAATTVLLSAPTASADGLPPLSLSKTALVPGDTVTVSGSGCLPNDEADQVSVFVALSGTASVTPAADGTWRTTLSVPTTVMGGHLTWRVQASCGHTPSGWADYPNAPVTVDAPYNWWQTCGPMPGVPGVSGCPGPPPNGSIPPARTPQPTAPRPTVTPPATGHLTTPTPTPPSSTPTPDALPSATGAAEPTAVPAPGCRDCARLTGRHPFRAGAHLALRYTGFSPGERITLVVHSTPVELGTFVADGSGAVAADVALPAVESGAHTLTLTGPVTGDRVVRFRLAASAPSTAADSPAPSPAPLLALAGGAAILLGGAGAVVLVRRRRDAAIG